MNFPGGVVSYFWESIIFMWKQYGNNIDVKFAWIVEIKQETSKQVYSCSSSFRLFPKEPKVMCSL